MPADPSATVAAAALRPRPVAADLLRPASAGASGLPWNLGLVIAGSLLVAAAARVAIQLPFSPVPVTMQSLAVLLVGALLGPGRGAAALATYLAQGAAGLPVFAAGAAGPLVLVGPTAGYLLAFVPAAALVGWLAARGWDRRPAGTLLAMTLGTALVLVVGTAWLAVMLRSVETAIAVGLAPFVPGAMVKIAIATIVLPAGWRWLRRLESREY